MLNTKTIVNVERYSRKAVSFFLYFKITYDKIEMKFYYYEEYILFGG